MALLVTWRLMAVSGYGTMYLHRSAVFFSFLFPLFFVVVCGKIPSPFGWSLSHLFFLEKHVCRKEKGGHII